MAEARLHRRERRARSAYKALVIVVLIGVAGTGLSVFDIVDGKQTAWPMVFISIVVLVVGVLAERAFRSRLATAAAADHRELAVMGEGGLPYGIGRHPEGFVVRAAAGIIALDAIQPDRFVSTSGYVRALLVQPADPLVDAAQQPATRPSSTIGGRLEEQSVS